MSFGKKAKYKSYHVITYWTSINALVIVYATLEAIFLGVFGPKPSLLKAFCEW